MNIALLRQRIKPWILPIAMVAGMLFHDFMGQIEFIAPYLIFIMLFITFCRVKPHEFRITALSWSLLSVQIIGALALYFIIAPMSVDAPSSVSSVPPPQPHPSSPGCSEAVCRAWLHFL